MMGRSSSVNAPDVQQTLDGLAGSMDQLAQTVEKQASDSAKTNKSLDEKMGTLNETLMAVLDFFQQQQKN